MAQNEAAEKKVEKEVVVEDEEHPLRILSEENLTVVSSFRGSAEDLDNLTNHDQVDPSKLSFFRIPDFGQISNPACNDMINQRFKEFEEMQGKSVDNGNKSFETSLNATNNDETFQDPRFANISIKSSISNNNNLSRDDCSNGNKVLSTFSANNEKDPIPSVDNTYSNPYGCYNTTSKPLYQNLNTPLPLAADPSRPQSFQELPDPSNFNLNHHQPAEISRELSPQKQFQLLSRSLRHPDGSSNPELSVVPVSQMEEEEDLRRRRQEESDVQNHEDTTTKTELATSPNNNTNNSILDNSNHRPTPDQEDNQEKPPAKMGFGQRFLKIFSSTRKSSKKCRSPTSAADCKRSKSCDERGEGRRVSSGGGQHQRSASNSPALANSRLAVELRSSKRSSSKDEQKKVENRRSGLMLMRSFRNNASKGGNKSNNNIHATRVNEVVERDERIIETTPSTLSLDTEWEFQGKENQDKSNDNELEDDEAGELLDDFDSIQQSFSHLMFNQNPVKKDRKSSGYDSLGGESSSLDSNQSSGGPKSQQQLNARGAAKFQPQAVTAVIYNTAHDGQPHQLSSASQRKGSLDPENISHSCSNNDRNSGMKLLQYEEDDILRMDKRRGSNRQQGSSLASSTNNSSPYSSIS